MKTLLTSLNQKQNFSFKVKSVDDVNHIVEGVFSSQNEDRHGEVVVQNGWILQNYLKNPVVLWAHQHDTFPIAKMISIGVDQNNQLSGKMQFAVDEYEFAATAFALIKGGFLSAFSAGFMNNKYQIDQENGVTYLVENELLEVSVVPIPANQLALAKTKGINVGSMEEKTVIPFTDHGTDPMDMAWDGPGQMMACGDDLGKLKSICAWYDSSNADVKSSYKLPHHEAGNLKANWRGVASAMGALLGSRGGVDIPEGDRQGVYAHLAKHYKQFGKDVPEFKAFDAEAEAIDTLSKTNLKTIRKAIEALTEVSKTLSETDNKVGEKVEHAEKSVGQKKVSVKLLNSAIRELLGVKKSL